MQETYESVARLRRPKDKNTVGHGELLLRLGNRFVSVAGGRYMERPHDWFGVKLAAEIGLPCDVNLPIRDFSVPDKKEAREAIKKTLKAMIEGRRVYVGCMGGYGRTGLFLALLAKVCGYKDPIGHVRAMYSERAVETEQQARFVEEFPVFWLRLWLWWRTL